ncbi:unnamed protein product [Microthlaspi erraticum]|uniref:Uncharacterized protein n=1 Tax=Microthlaspi erraticum TaxID=1685480 RepID=A0A6D2KFY6_9BRAS|nr:unnamed protein product [Microthlaspi erraticum]
MFASRLLQDLKKLLYLKLELTWNLFVGKLTLYKDVFPPALAPLLSFIGIPWKRLYRSHCLSCKASGSGRIKLPSKEDMMEDIKSFYATLEAQGVSKRYTHQMGITQFEYNDWLASQCGCSGTEEWRKEMYLATGVRKRAHPETYRDEWEDHHLVSQVYQDFSLYVSKDEIL